MDLRAEFRAAFRTIDRARRRIRWDWDLVLDIIIGGAVILVIVAAIGGATFGLLKLSDKFNTDYQQEIKRDRADAIHDVTSVCGPAIGEKFKVYVKATDEYTDSESWIKECLQK